MAVTVVAEFSGLALDDAVAAERDAAVVAAVIGLAIGVVTLFVGFIVWIFDVDAHHAIAAAGYRAIGAAAVFVDPVSIIAFLAIVDPGVAAAFEEAETIATIASLHVAIITFLEAVIGRS